MNSRLVSKITTVAIILVLVITMFTVMLPVIATPSESDVVNTTEESNTVIVGGDKIYISKYIRNYNPGYPVPRLWFESYYELYEYDTSTNTKTYLGLGTPIAASQDYLAYRYYYYKYWYTNFTRININTYMVMDLNTNLKTLWNHALDGTPRDLWGSNMVSTLMKPGFPPSTWIYYTDLSSTPYSPIFVASMSSGPSLSVVASAPAHIGGNYIVWSESTTRPNPVVYPYTLTYSIKMVDITSSSPTPVLLHQTTATWNSPFMYNGKRITLNTMDDKIVVWQEYDLATRTYESKYVDIGTSVKTSFSTKRGTGYNIARELIYYGFYDSVKRKTEIWEYDMGTSVETNTGITGYLDNVGNGVGFVLAMRTYEGQYGSDLNSDADTRDYIVRYLNMVIPATIDIDPDTLNLHSNGRWITVYIDLPAGFDVNNIAISTVTLDNTLNAEWCDVQNTTLMVKFDRLDVENLIGSPQVSVELSVEGQLSNGIPFKGQDSIQAINP
jgi:hypothetical protein